MAYFLKTPKHTVEYMGLIKKLYVLNYQDRKYALVDYFYQIAEKLENMIDSSLHSLIQSPMGNRPR